MPMSLLYSRYSRLRPELAVCSPGFVQKYRTHSLVSWFFVFFSLFSLTTPTSKKDKNKQYYHFATNVSCSISRPGLCCQCRYVDIHITDITRLCRYVTSETGLNRSTSGTSATMMKKLRKEL